MKTNKEWAKHIIRRFGKKEAYRWAIQDITWCPCYFLKYNCRICEFSEELIDHYYINSCRESKEYFSSIFIYEDRRIEIRIIVIKKNKEAEQEMIWVLIGFSIYVGVAVILWYYATKMMLKEEEWDKKT